MTVQSKGSIIKYNIIVCFIRILYTFYNTRNRNSLYTMFWRGEGEQIIENARRMHDNG